MADFFSTRIKLPEGFEQSPDILALGGEFKSSICLIKEGFIQVSAPTGDLEQENVYRDFTKQVETVLNEHTPEYLVIDKHPDYLSSQAGQRLADSHHIKCLAVQHHYAHIAAVMADNGLPRDAKPVFGFALDGLGFGEDGTIWGGEILLADYHGFQRLGCFQPAAMIGGNAASHEPWRNTMAQLLPIWERVNREFADTDIIQFLNNKPVTLLQNMVDKNLNAPQASSCGRLFDAVAAAIGLYRDRINFEAEAAIALEALATDCFEQACHPYPYNIDQGHCLQLNWQNMWLEILADIQNGNKAEIIASRFHHTLIHALTDMALQLRKQFDFDSVALSGGVFQNRLLSTHLPPLLESYGFTILQHQRLPAHDGGLSAGQAVIAAALFTYPA